jgi:hypothetical protein
MFEIVAVSGRDRTNLPELVDDGHERRSRWLAGIELGSNWDRTGIELGSNWDRTGIELGSNYRTLIVLTSVYRLSEIEKGRYCFGITALRRIRQEFRVWASG